MANCYIQIRCGIDQKMMTVGREYNFAIGEVESKMPANYLLDVVEEIVEKGLIEKYGVIYDLERSLSFMKEEK